MAKKENVKLPKGRWGVQCTERSSHIEPVANVQMHGDTLPGAVFRERPVMRTMFVAEDGSLTWTRLKAVKTTKGVALKILELAKANEDFQSPMVVKVTPGYDSDTERDNERDALKAIIKKCDEEEVEETLQSIADHTALWKDIQV